MELPPSRTAAVERLVEAGERLKRTLAGQQDVPFPSTVRPYLQALLDVLTKDAEEDFQKLQDTRLLFRWLSRQSGSERRELKLQVASAIRKALEHPGSSPYIRDSVILLQEVKDTLFCPSIWDPLSTCLFVNLLQVISEELHFAQTVRKEQENAMLNRRRLDEDALLDLASLLQKTVEFLESRENKSCEEVMRVDQADQTCWNTWHWDPYPASLIFDWSVVEMRDEDKDSVELPPSRKAAVEQLVKAEGKLKNTLARLNKLNSGTWRIPFPSTVKSYLKALLEMLTGDIQEDFQKLQNRFHGLPCFNKERYMELRMTAAFKEVMTHPGTSTHTEEAVKLLLEVKDKLFPPSHQDTQSTVLFGKLLQDISEELQNENITTKDQNDSGHLGGRLDEDACLDLAPLLQKTVKFLEARENKSREKVIKVDETDPDCWEPWRTHAKQLVEAEAKLKSEMLDNFFPQTVKPYVQALLKVLTGDAMEDFHKLQDKSHRSFWLSRGSRGERHHRKRKLAAAFEKAMAHPDTLPLIEEAMKTLLEVKDKMIHPSNEAAYSTVLFGNLLQNISEELQRARKEMVNKGSDQSRHRLDEDACLNLASLLQKTVEFQEARENKSREEAMEVDEAGWKCWMRWYWNPYPSCRIFSGIPKEIGMSEEIHQYFVVVFAERRWSRTQFYAIMVHTETGAADATGDGIRFEERTGTETKAHQYLGVVFDRRRWFGSRLSSFVLVVDVSSGRAWRGVMTPITLKLVCLLLLASLLGGGAASPLPARPRVQGGGRAEQGQAYNLTCVVEGLPGTDTISSYVWYKDGYIIRNKTQQVLMFPGLTHGDAGNYHCGPKRSDRQQPLLSEPFQLHVLVLENVVMVPEVEVEEGETAILNCTVHSVPTAHLLWIMDGKILRRVESNSDSLVLHNASRFHLKVFHCQASNSEFFKILRADTQIRIRGTFEIMPKPHLRRYGLPVLHQPFKLACVLLQLPEKTAHIRLTYTWFKDHREIPDQCGEEIQFSSLTKKDGGMYSCIARNGKPETTSPESNEVDLLVLLPPHVHMEPATPDNVIRRAAGEELTLTCNVTEAIPWVPADGYRWSYLPSHQGPRRPLVGRGKTLRLGPLTREDSGQYFCQARNDLEVFQGQIPPGNASITVNIVYLENITLTPDLEVMEGDHVTLTCSVESYLAANLTWIVDGQEVRYVTANVDHYVLKRAACSDSKTYTCRASNADLPGLKRKASTNIQVVCNKTEEEVPGPPSPPSLWLWLPWVLLLLVLTTTVILLYCCNRKFREKVDSTKAFLLSRKSAPNEEQSHQIGGGADPLETVSWRLAAEKEQPDLEGHEDDPLQTEDCPRAFDRENHIQ